MQNVYQKNSVYEMVGCIEDLRRFIGIFSFIATWKQEITNLWNRSG